MNKNYQIAQWFVQSRLLKKTVLHLPESVVPQSKPQAYEVQENVRRLSRQNVGAWKIGGSNEPTRQIFKTDEIYFGSIPLEEVNAAAHVPIVSASCRGEAEIAFKFNSQIETLVAPMVSVDEVHACIESVAACIELPLSYVEDIPAYGLNVLLADNCAAGSLVHGDFVLHEGMSFEAEQPVTIRVKSGVLAAGVFGNLIGGPLQVLYEFINLAVEHKLPLRSGHIVATGGLTSCVKLPLNEVITVDFGALGVFDFQLAG